MAEWGQIGKILLILGLGMALSGGALIIGAKFVDLDNLPHLGHLPGDIHVERKGFSCTFPLVTSILISLLLTVVLNIVARLLKR